MIYVFTVLGTHEGTNKNAIGYKRTTTGAKWDPKYVKYQNYKQFLVTEFWRQNGGKIKLIKPFQELVRGKVRVDIGFNSEVHPDPDNTVKAVLDALFVNDKEIDVETRHLCKTEYAYLVITITIDEDTDKIQKEIKDQKV